MTRAMPESPRDTIKDYYDGRHVFYTGATGMLGTAYLSRLVLETSVACVIAVVRGGESRLWDTWKKHLPLDMVEALRLSGKLLIWEGDITRPDCGLTTDQVATIHKKVSVVIHGASTINLQTPLADVAHQIIYPSLKLAQMALGCANLAKFVYVSTAYASAFLRTFVDNGLEGAEATIMEDVNHIRSHPTASAAVELSDLAAYGSTPEYEFVRHPYPYSYAKHLTERRLLEVFSEAELENKLMIFRPSCIGPAESKPYAFYEIPGSSPGTTSMAAVVASAPTKLLFTTPLADPSKATVDEVPVDIVINRLIAHTAMGTSGCVHAVAGRKGRRSSEELFDEAAKLRTFWWSRPKMIWCNEPWDSDKLCKLARLFMLCGCSFTFDEAKTELVWEGMSDLERSMWPLWPFENISTSDYVSGRTRVGKILTGYMLSKAFGLPTYFGTLLYKSRL